MLKTDYAGAAAPAVSGNVVETAAIRAVVDEASLCLRVEDRTRDAHLTTICPAELGRASIGLDIDPGPMRHVYGLGQEFKRLGSADGDWTAHGVREGVGDLGNGFQGFQRAAVGNVQIPVLYAVGDGGLNYALFVDNVYKQRWDFTASLWRARMFGDQLRFYVMTGPNLPDLRKDYMELSGRPPVPPRKAFGLWVSEFGYDNWGQIEDLRDGLRAGGFLLDGFVLDLNWFGGIVLDQPAQSEMGRLDWDRDQEPRLADNPYSFPDPADRIRRYAEDGIGLVAIEESYLADTTAAFRDMPAELSAYRRTDGRCARGSQGQPVTGVAGFWGVGRMVDWSDPAAGPGSTPSAAGRTSRTSASPRIGPTSASPRPSTRPPATTASRPRPPAGRRSTPTSTTSTTCSGTGASGTATSAGVARRTGSARPTRARSWSPAPAPPAPSASGQRCGPGTSPATWNARHAPQRADAHVDVGHRLLRLGHRRLPPGGDAPQRQGRQLPRLRGRALHPVARQRRLVRPARPPAWTTSSCASTRLTGPRRTWSGTGPATSPTCASATS